MYMESVGKEKTASIHTTWKKSHQWYVMALEYNDKTSVS